MRRSLIHSLTLLGVGLGLAGTLLAYAEPLLNASSATLTAEGQLTPRTRAVISGESAYLLGQPEVVAADIDLQKFVASPTGDAILIAANKRRPFRGVVLPPDKMDAPTSEFNLIYWDVRTRVAKLLFREAVRADAPVKLEQIEWLPQTRIALVVLCHVTVVGPPQPPAPLFNYSLWRADTITGKVSRVAEIESGRNVRYFLPYFVSASPHLPLAYVLTEEDTNAKTGPISRSSLRVYTPQGFRSRIALPDGVMGLTWLSDGKSVYADRIAERNAEGRIKVRKAITLVNLETGAVTQPETLPVIPKNERVKETPSVRESWAIDIATANAAIQNHAGKPQSTSALWLRAAASPKKEAAITTPANGPIATDALLIATNARLETQLATENTAAILFTRDGSLCAAPIFRLPAQAFEDALRRVQRTATLSNAKQVGLAIMMYSQDYDERLPLPGNGVKDATNPYLKNPSVFDNPGTGENGFVYSYSGPTSIGAVRQPATTQLGYVTGPGGRAVIWADGHVTWLDM